MNIIEWIVENWTNILAGFGGLVLVASIVVGVTPSTKDDSIMRKVIDIIDHISVLQTKESKEYIEAGKKHLKDGK